MADLDVTEPSSPSAGDHPLHVLTTSAATSIAAVGGIATAAYAAGYAYQWAYLAHFRAEWLIGELTTAEVLFNSGWILTILSLFISATIATAIEGTPSREAMIKHATWVSMSIVGVVLMDALLQHRAELEIRALLNAVATLLTSILVILISRVGFAAVATGDSDRTRDAVAAMLLVAFLSLAAVPGLCGKTQAIFKRGNVEKRLPAATIDTPHGRRQVPVLHVTATRVYCLTGSDKRTVVPVAWEHVHDIAGRKSRI